MKSPSSPRPSLFSASQRNRHATGTCASLTRETCSTTWSFSYRGNIGIDRPPLSYEDLRRKCRNRPARQDHSLDEIRQMVSKEEDESRRLDNLKGEYLICSCRHDSCWLWNLPERPERPFLSWLYPRRNMLQSVLRRLPFRASRH